MAGLGKVKQKRNGTKKSGRAPTLLLSPPIVQKFWSVFRAEANELPITKCSHMDLRKMCVILPITSIGSQEDDTSPVYIEDENFTVGKPGKKPSGTE